MSYPETIDFLFSRLPMYQRTGKAAYKADLSNTIKLCELLGNPEQNFPAVHIAGTNGKGSTASMVASTLHEAGYTVGLFTSPHLKDFRERIRINGKMISEKSVIDFVSTKREILDELSPSFFEWTAGLAFHHFAKQEVDIAVMEVGLGGRLDSTNVVNSIVSCITSIGMDHADLLGDSLEKIAIEKAGIAKPKVPMIIPEAMSNKLASVIAEKAEAAGTKLILAKALPHPTLLGQHQFQNAGCVFEIVAQLRTKGLKISDAHIALGFENIALNSGLRGRWETLNEDPKVIADVAHNEDGIRAMLTQLEKLSYNKLHLVFGCVSDKDLSTILPLLPKEAQYYFARPDVPRGLEVNALQAAAQQHGLKGSLHDSVPEAKDAAFELAEKNDLILVTGSVFVVAECI